MDGVVSPTALHTVARDEDHAWVVADTTRTVHVGEPTGDEREVHQIGVAHSRQASRPCAPEPPARTSTEHAAR
jgi:Xaa-Pro aminopeptidase